MAKNYFELWDTIRSITTDADNFCNYLTETAQFLVENRDEWIHIKCPDTWEELEVARVVANNKKKHLVFSEKGPLPDLSYYQKGYDDCVECFSELVSRELDSHDNPNPSLVFLPKIEEEMMLEGDTHGDPLSAFKSFFQENILERLERGDIGQVVFLGDYIDRGQYSPEMLTFVLWLKRLYPGKVTVIRGNHEYIDMCAPNEQLEVGSFYRELKDRFTANAPEKILVAAHKVFNALPFGAISHDRCETFFHAAMPFPKDAIVLDENNTPIIFNRNSPRTLFNRSNLSQMVWGDYDKKPVTGSQNKTFYFNKRDINENKGRGAGWLFCEDSIDIFPGLSTVLFRGHQWQSNMLNAINLDETEFKRTTVLNGGRKVITCFSTGEENTSGYRGSCIDPYYAILDPMDKRVTFRSINAEKSETIVFGMLMDLYMQNKLKDMCIHDHRLYFKLPGENSEKLTEKLNDLLRQKLMKFGHLYSCDWYTEYTCVIRIPLEHCSNIEVAKASLNLELVNLGIDEQIKIFDQTMRHQFLPVMLLTGESSDMEVKNVLELLYYRRNNSLMAQVGFQYHSEGNMISIPCSEMLQNSFGLSMQEEKSYSPSPGLRT